MGAHARRAYRRDSHIVGVARLHWIIRQSSSYGPMLPGGVLAEDGAEPGILFFLLGIIVSAMVRLTRSSWGAVAACEQIGRPPWHAFGLTQERVVSVRLE